MNLQIELYVDMDGVLADFDVGVKNLTGKLIRQQSKKAMWEAIKADHEGEATFFRNLPPMKCALEMFESLRRYNPKILTSTGHIHPEGTAGQKRGWIAEHIGDDIEVITVRKSDMKAQWVTGALSVLIDDRSKSIDPWNEAGGTGILHVHPSTTLNQIMEIVQSNDAL
jgi:hypothetical protein